MNSIKLSELDRTVLKMKGKSNKESYSFGEAQRKIVIKYLFDLQKTHKFTLEKIENTKEKRTTSLIEIKKNGKKYLCTIATKQVNEDEDIMTVGKEAADIYSGKDNIWYALLAVVNRDEDKVVSLRVVKNSKENNYLKDVLTDEGSKKRGGNVYYKIKIKEAKKKKIIENFEEWIKGK